MRIMFLFQKSLYFSPKFSNMRLNQLLITLICCCCFSAVTAQKQKLTTKKKGLLTFNASVSDYEFVKKFRDSSFSHAFQPGDYFKSGNTSFGLTVGYWRGLGTHVDFSGNLGGTFSNFPKFFVKGDSIGQAGFSTTLDVMLHARAFKNHVRFNPFLSGGIGAGYFGGEVAAYAPVGVGLQLRLGERAYVMIQSQWRKALTTGITDDYTYYSLGFGQQGRLSPKPKKETPKKEIPAKETEKKEPKKKETESKEPVKVYTDPETTDTDGDGVVDAKDKCPTEKGTVYGCPDRDGDYIADKDDKCPDEKGHLRYDGCPIPDSDGDGVNDEIDKCPNVKGDKGNFGCPLTKAEEVLDTDGDGIPDKIDRCPTIKGTAENFGCPFKVAKSGNIIKSTDGAMTYNIRFDFDRVELLSDAFGVLKQVVEILKADKTLRVEVAGHADQFGTDEANMQISAERAKIVKDYFKSWNIDPKRITTNAYGATQPISTDQTWLNRRVEISLIKQ